MIAADVVVVGAGPAGSWCARALALGGARVALLHHAPGRPSTVELLSPRARQHLCEFSIPGVEVRERKSRWSPSETCVRNAFFKPHGLALSVERSVLDASLRVAAAAAGAHVISHRVRTCHRDGSGWLIDAHVRARHLVLATGGRQPGPHREALVAQCWPARFARYDVQTQVLTIERLPAGWMYSIPIPGGGTFVGACTPAPVRADELVRSSTEHSHLTGAAREEWTGSAAVRMFGEVAGDNWLAIGNAAFQPDPLSGEGLWFAFETARDAACVILERSDPSAFARRIGLLVESHLRSRKAVLGSAW